MKALEKNQNFVLGRKSFSAISKRSFSFQTCPASKLLQKSFAFLFLTGYDFWSWCKMLKAKEEEELRTKTDNLRQKFYHSNSNIQVFTWLDVFLIEDHYEVLFSCSAGWHNHLCGEAGVLAQNKVVWRRQKIQVKRLTLLQDVLNYPIISLYRGSNPQEKLGRVKYCFNGCPSPLLQGMLCCANPIENMKSCQ